LIDNVFSGKITTRMVWYVSSTVCTQGSLSLDLLKLCTSQQRRTEMQNDFIWCVLRLSCPYV